MLIFSPRCVEGSMYKLESPKIRELEALFTTWWASFSSTWRAKRDENISLRSTMASVEKNPLYSRLCYKDNRINKDFSRTFTDPYRDWKRIPTSCLDRPWITAHLLVSKSTHGFITHTMLERAATRTMKRITSLGNNDARARFADSEISREPAARLWFTPCNLINHRLLAIGIESSRSLAHVILRFRVLRHGVPFSPRKPNVRGSVSRRYDSTGEFLQQ